MSAPELFFDLGCPWSYLATVRMQDVADRNGTRVELKAVNVQQVLETENPSRAGRRFAENPNKEAWQRKDLGDWAALWGLRIELPETWPFDASAANAAAAVAIKEGKGLAFALTAFAACYRDGKDITDADVLADIAADTGLDREAFAAALGEPSSGAQVSDWGEELVRRGGFGTPTVLIGDDLYFGNDRIPLVDFRLSPISSADFVMPGQHDG